MFNIFKFDSCIVCGECFYRCPYLKLDREEAVLEKKKLLEGKESSVLRQCVSCYACNAFCPRDCHPYELILKRWFENYQEKGLPIRAEYLLPSSMPNFRTDLVQGMEEREQELVKKWQETKPEGEVVLYPGCNGLALPHLLDASFLEEIPIAGTWDLCCGEMHFRMGLFDQVKRTAGKLTEYYRDKKIGTMLFQCPACLNMFSNILPNQFGARFDFEKKYLGTYLLEKMEVGQIRPEKKLNKKVTVHDSCHARVMNGDILDDLRLLLEKCGAEVVEMELTRVKGFCCGAAAGAKRYNPFDILSTAAGVLKESKKTDASELAIYCGGCQLTLNMCRLFLPSRQPVRHMLEYVKESCGEGSYNPTRKRCVQMMLNILFKCFPKYLSARRFWISGSTR